MLENTFTSSLYFSFLCYTQIKGFCYCLDRKKSPLQILATSTYTPEQRRKCPGSPDNMLAEHSCFEDVENLFNFFFFFLTLLHIFQRVQKNNDRSENWGTLHLLPEPILLLLLFLLLVFLFCNACLWTITLDITGDHEQYPHLRCPKTKTLRKYLKGGLPALSTSCYAKSQKLDTMHLSTIYSPVYRVYN